MRQAEQRTHNQLADMRAAAEAALAQAALPIEVPADIVSARVELVRLGEESSALSKIRRDAETAVENARLHRKDVHGVWAWVAGKTGAAERRLREAETGLKAARDAWKDAGELEDAAVERLAPREREWEQTRAGIEQERSAVRQEAERRLRWAEASLETLRRHPELARKGFAAVQEETRLRLAAARAARVVPTHSTTRRPPSYRPRGPR